MVTLDTPRLILRPPTEADVEPLAEIHRDPEVARYALGGTPTDGIEIAWRNVAMLVGHWHIRGYGAWVVEERASGEVIGRVGLWHPAGWPGVELGWAIRRSRWDHGFATEAAARAVAWVAHETTIARLISLIQPDNLRSVRVARKLGAEFETERRIAGTTFHQYTIVPARD